jgi:hypothetical protein
MSQKERQLSSTKKRQQKIKEQTNDFASSPPSLSSHESSSSPEFANIAIKIYNFENLQYLDEQSHEEFEIVAKFMNTKINSDTAVDESRHFSANNKNSFKITFNIQVDVSNEEETVNVCASPILLSLLKHKGNVVTVLGHCSIDMLVLCTPHVESRTFYKLSFEREFSGQVSYFRRISFDCLLSIDVPLLKAPYGNMLFLTFDSIHNLNNTNEITIGFRAPMGCEVCYRILFKSYVLN